MLKLGVFMPSFGRRDIALNAIRNLCEQARLINSRYRGILEVSITLRCNNDSNYSAQDFTSLGCNFLMSSFNEGADANIAHGFFYAIQHSLSYLWIVGDDEPISDTALNSICSILLGSKTFDAIIGSKNELGVAQKVTSFQELNSQVGTTASFISSTIYRCKFDEAMCEQAFRFSYTGYSHLAIQNMLIENGAWNCLYLIDIQSLVDYHAKVQSDPLKSRVNYGMRDSFVFFGKILSSLAVANQEYVKSEFYYWWRNNWHRVSMYLSRDETNGWAVLGVSLRYRRLFFHIFLSLFPWWKIKEILKPIPLSRETQCPDRK